MLKHVAYVGASSPIGYDYNLYEKYHRPNPILEAPLGLFVLYDEIWFMHPTVCPYNMEDLEYVRIISDREDLSDYISKLPEEYNYGELDDYPWKEWDKTIRAIAPFARYDNHTKGSMIADIRPIVPQPTSIRNIYLDQLISIDKRLEHITNTPTHRWITRSFGQTPECELVEKILSRRVPNYQSSEGPHLDVIDDIRKLNNIRKFREKIHKSCEGRNLSKLDEIVEELESEFDRIRNIVLKEKIEGTIYNGLISIAFALFSIPGISQAVGGVRGLNDIISQYRDRQKYGWAGFLTEVELMEKSR